MFELLSSIPLSPATAATSHEIFALATHPTESIYSIGLSTGHVHTFNLPTPSRDVSRSSNGGGSDSGAPINGSQDGPQPRRSSLTDTGYSGGAVELLWKTRRHKGSCRALAFTGDGKFLFSAGSDGIVKAAHTESGVVVSKIAVPHTGGHVDSPTNLCVLSPRKLVVTTDAGYLHIYDISLNPSKSAQNSRPLKISQKPTQTLQPHISKTSNDAHISSITPLPPSAESTSNVCKQLFTTGDTTISITDIVNQKVRFNSVGASEDEDYSEPEDLLSSIYIPLSKSDTGVVAVGDGSSTLSFFERGEWRAPVAREKINLTGETLDAMCLLPETVGFGSSQSRLLAAGCGDGRMVIVSVEVIGENVPGSNSKNKKRVKNVKFKVEKIINHDDEMVDGVVGIGWVSDPGSDSAGRMISVGGNTVRIWGETVATGGQADVGTLLPGFGGVEDDSDSDSDGEPDDKQRNGKRRVSFDTGNGPGEGDEDDDDSESDSDTTGKKRKKRKKGKQAKKARLANSQGGINVSLKGL